MAGESRKWMILVATIWIQAFTGTNFDFSAYSSTLKSVLGISQVQLNYLAVASDLGKAFGWSSGLASKCLPLWVVLFIAAFMGLFGYGLQWFIIRNLISLPYFPVFLLCLLSGCSICWFNTVCFILCNRNFPSSNRPLAISLTVSFNGVSPALYALAANAIDSSSSTPSLYLLLNSLIPLITSLFALIPILRQPPLLSPLPVDAVRRDSLIFLLLNLIAVVTGLYLLLLPSSTSSTTGLYLLLPSSTSSTNSRLLFSGALFLLILPLFIPGIIYARSWFRRAIQSHIQQSSGFLLVDVDDLELHKELISRETGNLRSGNAGDGGEIGGGIISNGVKTREGVLGRDSIVMLGEEHEIGMLLRRLDFWLYFLAYFCGGTIGLVYSNSLGQIAQSLGYGPETSMLITLYSSFSFFGRLLSAAPDFMRVKVYFARTGWLAIALIPTPIAFFLLAASSTATALHAGTALIGLSSGFIFAAAVSVTSELFGPNNVGVNHNILITNIPMGSLVYGLLASLIYDANAAAPSTSTNNTVVCMGRECYFLTFVGWGCISIVGLASSVLLFLRTRPAYDRYENNRSSTQLY